MLGIILAVGERLGVGPMRSVLHLGGVLTGGLSDEPPGYVHGRVDP